MPRVTFLGWPIDFPAGGGVATPVAGATVHLDKVKGVWRLSATIDASIGGLRIRAQFDNIALKSGPVLTPTGGDVSRFQMVRPGEDPDALSSLRILAGPIWGAGSARATVADFDPATGALIVALPPHLLGDADASALAIDLDKNKALVVNLEKAKVFLPAGTFVATVFARKSAAPPMFSATFHSAATAATFAESAAARPGLSLLFAADEPTKALQLAVTDAGPGLLVSGGSLEVVTRREAGALKVIDLALVGAPLELECFGLWDSHNRAERWNTKRLRLGVAARKIGEAGWRSLVVAPTAAANPLTRDDRWSGATPLPMHGHPAGLQYVFAGKGASGDLVCRAVDAERGIVPAWLDGSLAWRRTRPWLRAPTQALLFTRPGASFTNADAGVWRFKGGQSAAPLIPLAHWSETEDVGALTNANRFLDGVLGGYALQNPQAAHESGLDDASTGTPKVLALQANAWVQTTKPDLTPLRLTANTQTRVLRTDLAKAAPLSLNFTQQPEASIDYAAAWVVHRWLPGKDPQKLELGALAAFRGQLIDPGVPITIDAFHEPSERRSPVAILKTGRDLALKDILADVRARLSAADQKAFDDELGPQGQRLLAQIQAVDPSILERAWVGLLLIRIQMGLGDFPQLAAMVPTTGEGAPVLDFIAVSPKDTSGALAGAVSAAVSWKRLQPTDYAQSEAAKEREARFWAETLNIAWRDSRLTNFQSEALLELRSLFGAGEPVKTAQTGANLSEIRIYGSAKRREGASPPEYDFRFAARTTDKDPRGLKVYPIRDDGTDAEDHLVQEVWLRAVELIASTRSANASEILIDGDIKFGRPKFFTSARDFLEGGLVQFTGLSIDLPSLQDFKIPTLDIHYPNLRFNLNLPHVDLLDGAFRLKFNQIQIDWSGVFDFSGLPDLDIAGLLGAASGWRSGAPSFLLRGTLSFGALPELFGGSLSDFSLEVVFGLQLNLDIARPFNWIRVGARGVGFEGLDLDLLRFFRLRIEKLKLGAYAPSGTALTGQELAAKNVEAWILNYKLPFHLSGAYASVQGGGGDAFWLLAETENTDVGVFDFHWGFVGQNLRFEQSLIQGLLDPPTLETTREPHPIPARDTLYDAWEKGSLRPRLASDPGQRGAWVFGASISAAYGAFTGRALVQDGGFVGVSLAVADKGPGKAIVDYLGAEFAILGIYAKGPTSAEDYFYMSLTLGGVTLPAFRLIAGAFDFTLFANGGLITDFGFPRLAPGGGRLWERTIGAIVTPGQASAGFYFKKIERPGSSPGSKELTLGAGYALQWGIGGAWGSGAFQAWVRLGLYVVMEGEVTFEIKEAGDLRLTKLRVAGAGGILLDGRGRIDWWVICIEVGVRASAEIRTDLIYDVAANKGQMSLTAELYVSASASACVGGGPFRICRSIKVGLHVPVQYQLEF